MLRHRAAILFSSLALVVELRCSAARAIGLWCGSVAAGLGPADRRAPHWSGPAGVGCYWSMFRWASSRRSPAHARRGRASGRRRCTTCAVRCLAVRSGWLPSGFGQGAGLGLVERGHRRFVPGQRPDLSWVRAQLAVAPRRWSSRRCCVAGRSWRAACHAGRRSGFLLYGLTHVLTSTGTTRLLKAGFAIAPMRWWLPSGGGGAGSGCRFSMGIASSSSLVRWSGPARLDLHYCSVSGPGGFPPRVAAGPTAPQGIGVGATLPVLSSAALAEFARAAAMPPRRRSLAPLASSVRLSVSR